jgi:hypothetical protein
MNRPYLRSRKSPDDTIVHFRLPKLIYRRESVAVWVTSTVSRLSAKRMSEWRAIRPERLMVREKVMLRAVSESTPRVARGLLHIESYFRPGAASTETTAAGDGGGAQ